MGERTPTQARRRVVVTGLGAVTPVGLTVDSTWKNLLAGVSGVDRITQFDTSDFPTHIAGEVKDFRLPAIVEPKEARRMSRFELFAIACVEQALADACLFLPAEDPEAVGVVLGTGIGSLTTTQNETKVLLQKGGMRINPFFLPMMLPNMATAQVTRLFNIQGYNSTIVTACASGGQAIGEAAEVIRRGDADVVISGGVDASICDMGLASFAVLRALSQRNDDPTRASRPFDLNRDGLVPGEAGAVLILESLEHANARNAKVLAELVGFGVSSDAYHVVAPHPEGRGAAQAMRRALRNAGLTSADVDYINAHATSTVLGDSAESKAIKLAFGDDSYRVPISATKAMIGHSMGGAGAVGAMVAVLTIRDGWIHPTTNYETPDPECDLDYVPNEARKVKVDVAMANSFAFGGHNSVLVFQAPPDRQRNG